MKTILLCSKLICTVLFTIALSSVKLNAQKPTLEFTSGAGNPTGNGPSVADQVITFQNNTNNPSGNTFAAYTPKLTATFALSNQQYTLPSSQISTTKGVSFGAYINNSGISAPAEDLFPQMSSISSPSNSNFTSSTAVTAGTGIDISTNRAIGFLTSVRPLYNASASTSGRYYYADLKITFNQPVTNPILHVVGLGGSYPSPGLGFSTELELQTFGVTLSKLSGSSELTVSSGKKILNSSADPDGTTGDGAATGSVLATGAGMTSLTFKIYMRGNGNRSTWGSSSNHQGDVWLMGVSLNTTSVNVILPVKLESFSAMLNSDNKADIRWRTAGEMNVSHFAIERSVDGKNYNDAGIVFANGNTTEEMNYSFSDNLNSNQSAVVYYRLRSVDADGGAEYSETRVIRITKKTETAINVVTYPNPVSNELRVTIPNNWQNKKVSYEVYNSNGQVSVRTETGSSSQTENINVSALGRGIYIVKVTCDDQIAQQKIVKQ